MKIGQVTMYGDNYGACLQAYALQKVLQENGHEIKLINYHQVVREKNDLFSKLRKANDLGLKKTLKYIRERKYIELRKKAYKKFRDNYLAFDEKEYYRGDDLKKLNDEFDCFICGSDMIWSEEFSEDWPFFFLGFAEKDKSFTYAPSFGKNSLTEKNKKKVTKYLQDFKKISCREKAGIDLIKSLGDFEATQVVDPTMLLTRDDWVQCIPEKNRIINEPYVFAYLFGEETDGRYSFNKCVEEKIGKIYALPKFTKKEQSSFPIEEIGPMEYLRLFRDAEFIVTDTFHGLMFSLIFRKPFVVLKRHDGSNWSRYSDRMTSTLDMFGLEERYIDDSFRDLEQLKKLDYEKYETTINKARKHSLDYINKIFDEAKHG